MAWSPADGPLGTLAKRVAEVSADTLVSSLLNWPALAFLLLVWMGKPWLQRYLESIRKVGSFDREQTPPFDQAGAELTAPRVAAKEEKP